MEMDYSTIMSNGKIFPAPYDVVSILYFFTEELTLWSPAFPGFFLFFYFSVPSMEVISVMQGCSSRSIFQTSTSWYRM